MAQTLVESDWLGTSVSPPPSAVSSERKAMTTSTESTDPGAKIQPPGHGSNGSGQRGGSPGRSLANALRCGRPGFEPAGNERHRPLEPLERAPTGAGGLDANRP